MQQRLSRRTLLASGSAVLFSACTPSRAQQSSGSTATQGVVLPGVARDGEPPPTATSVPPTATPTRIVPPAGSEERMLLEGTPWESPLFIRHSGKAGPTALVLGGVHGNEPGGWQAALDVVGWQPAAGSLIVLPRANRLAINSFVRTFDEIGDLNRLYPGNPTSDFAMERMAAAIVSVAMEFHADLLLDMHESWQFYVDAPGTGTAALGQTVTGGVGPANPALAQAAVTSVNAGITPREAFIIRDGSPFARATTTPGAGATTRGRSSLSVGGFVPGLTPVLVEMGQQGQEIPRRVELHLMMAQALLQILGVL